MSDKLTVYAAWSREPVEELPLHSAEEVEAMLASAQSLYTQGALPKSERLAILQKAAVLLSERTEEFARRIALEGGKPYTDAVVEAVRAAASVESAASVLAHDAGREIPMGLTPATEGYRAYTRKEPIGPVVAVSAFNHPLNLIAHQVAPAVAAGCPVIVKPAETTPLSCLAFIDLLREAGLPKEWAHVALVEREQAEKLVTDTRLRFFSFIGSARVGWFLRSKLAPGVRCALEHGGAAPVIVAADADLDDAVVRLAKGGYYHAGQVCVSTQRIFIHEAIYQAFVEKFVPVVEKLRVGDPLEAQTEVGPLILPREVERVDSWVKEAIEGGANCLCGGKPAGPTAYEPTVLEKPAADAKVTTQEIFGPVTVLFPYRNLDTAIAQANALPWSFQASIFSHDLVTVERASAGLSASTVMVNEHSAFRADWMPFAGWDASGLDTGGIPYSYHSMTREKMVVTRTS